MLSHRIDSKPTAPAAESGGGFFRGAGGGGFDFGQQPGFLTIDPRTNPQD
jgi:hypothetical protein